MRLFQTVTLVILTGHLDAKKAGELSTLFDVGGIFGESITAPSAATNINDTYEPPGPGIA